MREVSRHDTPVCISLPKLSYGRLRWMSRHSEEANVVYFYTHIHCNEENKIADLGVSQRPTVRRAVSHGSLPDECVANRNGLLACA